MKMSQSVIFTRLPTCSVPIWYKSCLADVINCARFWQSTRWIWFCRSPSQN